MKYINERGNASFFLIWIIFIMGMMLILIMDIASAFIVKQEASNASEQASIAATEVFYQGIREAVADYDQYQMEEFDKTALPGEVFPEERKLSYKIEQQEYILLSSGNSRNESAIQAIDDSVGGEWPGLNGMLASFVDHSVNSHLNSMMSAASAIITRNGGKPSESEIVFFENERIKVKAAVHFEGKSFQGFIPKVEDDMLQEGSGPKIDFADQISSNPGTFSLNE